MLEFNLDFITGVMVGIEFPNLSEVNEDIEFAMVIDLLILRFQFIKWKTAE